MSLIANKKSKTSKLFDSHFSTKASNKVLGLSISKRIVEAHNGRLYHDADQPETTFVIELPAFLMTLRFQII